MKIPEHERGRRDGLRWAVTWLHERANEMNDPHATLILHSAATNLGWDLRDSIDLGAWRATPSKLRDLKRQEVYARFADLRAALHR